MLLFNPLAMIVVALGGAAGSESTSMASQLIRIPVQVAKQPVVRASCRREGRACTK